MLYHLNKKQIAKINQMKNSYLDPDGDYQIIVSECPLDTDCHIVAKGFKLITTLTLAEAFKL
jgi:hypothetical protein